MKANKTKVEIAMARMGFNLCELVAAAEMPYPTVKNVVYGRSVTPKSVGKVAKALGVDVTEILEEV